MISDQLVDEDNFIDMKFLRRQDVREATHRFKLCQKFVEYLKNLGYTYDRSFNVFLFPNVKDTRQLLGFMFELIFSQREKEQRDQEKEQRTTNAFEDLVKQRIKKWQKKPWILPDFYEGQRRDLLIGGEVIHVDQDVDFQRVAGSKSKKAKGIY